MNPNTDPLNTPTPEQEIPPPKKKGVTYRGKDGDKKFRPRADMREAIMECLLRSKAGFGPEYKIVAAKWKVNVGSLKRLCWDHNNRGNVELGSAPDVVEKKKLDLTVANERSFRFLMDYETLLQDAGEEMLRQAKVLVKKGEPLAFQTLGIPRIVSQLMQVRTLRNIVEKGNFDALIALMEAQQLQQAKLLHNDGGRTNLTQNNTTIHVHANGGDPLAGVKTVSGASVAGGAAIRTNQQSDLERILSAAPEVREVSATPAPNEG